MRHKLKNTALSSYLIMIALLIYIGNTIAYTSRFNNSLFWNLTFYALFYLACAVLIKLEKKWIIIPFILQTAHMIYSITLMIEVFDRMPLFFMVYFLQLALQLAAIYFGLRKQHQII